MKANELKINNLVLDVNNVPKTIKAITSYGDLAYVSFEGEMHRSPTQEIRPIILTEEWLLKFNKWKKEGDLYIRRLDTIVDSLRLDYINDDGELCWEFYVHNISGEKVGCAYIKHVHQLQNLFFCLSGEELILKVA